MKRIGLISDTHGFLDIAVFRYFSDCDEIWHAGDIGTMEVAEDLAAFKPLKAVFGNIDGKDLRFRFPETQLFQEENLKILMIHIAGAPPRYSKGIKKILNQENPSLLICGHSHILRVTSDPDFGKMIYMNPGAAGKQGFHKIRTLLKLDLNAGKIENVKAIELGKR